MAERRGREEAIEELETVLQTEDEVEKDFHIRQALQLLELDGGEDSELNTENRDDN